MRESEICVKTKDASVYIFILLCIIVFFLYIYTQSKIAGQNQKEQLSNIDFTQNMKLDDLKAQIKLLNDELYTTKLSEQKCQIDLQKSLQMGHEVYTDARLLNKIYNPLVAPERIYPGGTLYSRGYNDYQMLGYVYKGNERYPLFGRYKYPGKTDKYEYYLVDESRNKLKIPFKSRNDNELMDGETTFIQELGDNFNVKIYDYENFRYNPYII